MGQPLNNIIVIKPEAQETELGGFTVVTDRTKFMPEKGEVKSVGDECKYIKEGMSVLFRKGAYSKVTIDNEEVLLVEEKNVFYIL